VICSCSTILSERELKCPIAAAATALFLQVRSTAHALVSTKIDNLNRPESEIYLHSSLASTKANLIPIQLRRPWPNGKYALGLRLALFSLLMLSGFG
jgi:hypothetical protein